MTMRRASRIESNQFKIGRFSIFVLVFAAIGAYILLRSMASTPPGASTATCSPSPCTQGTAVSHTISVLDSDGADAKAINQTYYVERPTNLTNSSTNLAPLLVLFANPNPNDTDTGEFETTLAPNNKFVILFIPNTHAPCTSGCQYATPDTYAWDPATTGAIRTCGTTGTSACDDMIWLQAVLQRIVCSGASPCENIDPAKVYVAGASKGGTATHAAICDSRTSNYFSGAVAVSSLLISPSTNNDQTAAANCPALLGTSNGWGGTAGQPANTDISVAWFYGDADTLVCASAPASSCLNTGYTDAQNRWQFSNPQEAGDSNPPAPGTAAGSNVQIGHRLGCSGTPSSVVDFGNTNKLHKKIYTSCAKSNRATETILVNGGGHAWHGLNLDGFDSDSAAWDFLANYGGPAATSSSSPTANVFVAPNGSDSGINCKRFATAAANPDPSGATVCATFDKAYHVANSGDKVGVLGGTFPYQRLTFDATKTSSAHVVFAPYNGAVVHSDTIDFGNDQQSIQSAQHVELHDFILDNNGASVATWSTSNDIELDNLTGHALQLLGGTNLAVNGGDWGKCTVTSVSSSNCTSRMIGTNVVIDGASFHDVVHDGTQDPQNLNHTEGIFVRGCSNCTINHSKFWHNTTFNVFLQNCCSLPPNQNVKIYNNWLAADGTGATGNTWTGGTALEVTNSIPGFQLIHNSFAENSGPVWAFNTQGDSWAGTNALTADNLYQRGPTGRLYTANTNTVNTTIAQNIYLFPTWQTSSASNTVTAEQFIVTAY